VGSFNEWFYNAAMKSGRLLADLIAKRGAGISLGFIFSVVKYH
jgi:tetrahydromethanopterin S-methyltransferase subunit F